MHIMANRMDRTFHKYQDEFEQAALKVLRSGWYVLGEEVQAFEKEFAAYTSSNYCIGLASGLDALWIAFRALNIGPGDEVIVQANTYIASVMGITINGATPVFVEPDEYYNIDVSKIEEKISPRTKAILIVHLYGQAANMTSIMRLAHKYGLNVVEDCAQSHGACFAGKMTGTFGDIGCFSFYPSKNLGAYGDAGAIVTNDAAIADFVRMFRNYGSEKRYYNKIVGANSRLDEMQAALLRIKLTHLEELNQERKILCQNYLHSLVCSEISLPQIRQGATHVWHQFVIRCSCRDKLISYLREHQIDTLIHYPIPPHLSEAYSNLGYHSGCLSITENYAEEVLSLPLYNGMTDKEQNYVIECINSFNNY